MTKKKPEKNKKQQGGFLLYLFPEFLHPLDDEYELGDEITQLLIPSGNPLVYTESTYKALQAKFLPLLYKSVCDNQQQTY